MLAVSRTFTHCKQKPLNSILLCRFNPYSVLMGQHNFRNRHLNGIFEKLSSLGPNTSSQRVYRDCQNGVSLAWIWPFFAILSNSVGSFKSFATQSSCNELEVTDEFLNQILLTIQSTASDAEICTSIERLCRAGSMSTLAKLLQSLRDKHIFLCDKAYNLLLVAASEENDVELSLQIFKDLLVSSKSLSSKSYFNLAKVFANTRESVLLLKFVTEVSRLAFPRSTTVINRIIFAFAECGLTDKSLRIYNHMKSLKHNPDLVTYNIVMAILGQAGRVEDMLLEFASMKEANIVPDIISYNTLINNLQKLRRLDLCLVYMKEMRENGLQPDLRTYTAMIESFGRSGNIEESMRLFNEMKNRRIRPSIYIYKSLINNSKKVGKFEVATSLLEEMNLSTADLVGPKDFKGKRR